MVLLYLDVLGMKARWKEGGVATAKATYRTLDLVIRHALESVPDAIAGNVSGGVQSDAAALTCPAADQAVTVGRAIFREAFRRSGSLENNRERLWVRGVIIDMATDGLEQDEALPGAASGVSKRVFSDDLLQAINVEQSGYQGQRLLIEESLVLPALEQAFSVAVGDHEFHALASPDFIPRVQGFRDVLWMFPPDPEDQEHEWELMKVAMQNRLRWSSGGGPGEFTQAAATQLVFAACETIYVHLRGGADAN